MTAADPDGPAAHAVAAPADAGSPPLDASTVITDTDPPAASATPAATLDYATAATSKDPWRPILFRPSGRSVLLFLLMIAASLWLSLRHHPWRHVATIPADYLRHPLFAADGRLLVFDTRHGVKGYDAANGRALQTVLPSIDAGTYRYFLTAHGREILALPHVDRTALVYDATSGRLVRRLPNPDPLGSMLVAVAPDAPRFVTTDHARTSGPGGRPASPNAAGAVWWDLTGKSPVRTPLPFDVPVEFSPDGRYLLHRRHAHSNGYGLTDAATLRDVADVALPHGVDPAFEAFAGAGHFWTVTVDGRTSNYRLDVYAVPTGRRVGTVDYGPRPRGTSGPMGVQVSADAARAAAVESTPAGPGVGINLTSLVVRDVATGAALYDQPFAAYCAIRFFPDNRRLIAGHRDSPAPAVIDPRYAQPLAVLPVGDDPGGGFAPIVSPDGRTIAVPVGPGSTELALFRPAGFDCPESPLGALAFPHLYLTAALFTGLALSLTADARRARPPAVNFPPPTTAQVGLIAVALPLTVYFILTACLGRWAPALAPAPLLLVAAIGLAAHGRFWRLVTMLSVAGVLPLLLYAAHVVRRADLKAASRHAILDRFYDVPHLPAFAGLCVLAAGAAAMVYLLARPRA